MKYRLIEDDFYHIAERIKYINRFYVIKYNPNKHLFEVHDSRLKNNSLCFASGSRLDANTIKKAVNTQSKFARQIFKSVDDNNRKLDQKNNEYLKDFANQKLKSYIEYLDSHSSSDISFDTSDKTTWL